MNLGDMDKIAVLIPAYNEEENIGNTLESLLNQTIKPHWILIGDNESTDNTIATARRTLEKHGYTNYKIIRVKRIPDLGKLNINIVYSTLNKALQKLQANPDYVATIEADVILEPLYLEKLIRYFKKNPKLCIAGGKLEPLGLPKDPFPLKVNVNLWGGNRLYRADCWRKLNQHIDIAQLPAWDTDHVILALHHGYHVTQVPQAKSHTKRGIRTFKGKPKGITDAQHGLPLWWAIYKTIQYQDPIYIQWYITTRIKKPNPQTTKKLKPIKTIYQYAATHTLITKLKITQY